MIELNKETSVAVLGAGAMGSGIAQIAASFGHKVKLYDIRDEALNQARESLRKILERQAEKGQLTRDEAEAVLGRMSFVTELEALADCGLVIEAVVEHLDVKQKVFGELEKLVAQDCVLASNTSSLSIASIAGGLQLPGRVLGAHFFNPAPLMPLVEIIPGVATHGAVTQATRQLIDQWGKVTVLARDTPGFIVNRVARPFYGEALRMLDEGLADVFTIDWAMKELGGFRMGPFQLMDFIGHDVNYKVTETVFKEFYYDPRFKPSLTQKRLVEAGRLGRKSGRGFYSYREDARNPPPNEDRILGQVILDRILAMLINEAIDAVHCSVATAADVDLAMVKGVNYPQGLLRWADAIGLEVVLNRIDALYAEYHEDRYRACALLRRMVREGRRFFD